MDVSVIIVNYNTAEEVRRCVDSVLMQEGVTKEIFVIDNASKDASVSELEKYGKEIHLIKSQENLGFPCANNVVFPETQGKYIYMLNPDAWFVQVDALKKLFDYLETHAMCGLLSTSILSEDEGKVTLPRYYYPGEKHINLNLGELPGKIAWVLGASMMLPRRVFEEIQGFDADLFMYGDDVDIGLRTRQAGYEVHCLESVRVYHIGGASEKQTPSYSKTIKKQRALHYLYKKFYTSSVSSYLVRREWRRARRRYRIYQLKNIFIRTEANKNRKAHYRAVCDTCKEFFNA